MAQKSKAKKIIKKRGSPAPAMSGVRNTVVPRQQAQQQQQPRKEISRDMIAKRAYEIWKSGKGGSERDNWLRAERELRGT